MRKLILAILIMASGKVFCQGIEDPLMNIVAPKVVPPSPNAAALTKYAGAEVSLNTGVISQNVSLYTFQAGKISLPISLNYSSNGVRVNEFPSLTGMSWVLNAGGVITRTVNGAVDEESIRQQMPDESNVYTQSNFEWVHRVANAGLENGYDSEADVFSFSFLNYSGKFIFDENGIAVLLPHANLKIEANFASDDYTFIITDGLGVKYFFGGLGGTERTFTNNSGYANTMPHPFPISTGFYLTKILHPSGDYVDLKYQSYNFSIDPLEFKEIDNHKLDEVKCLYSSQGGGSSCPASSSTIRIYADYYNKILTQISSPGVGTISFAYTDYTFLPTGGSVGYKRLSSLKIKDANGITRKAGNFFYSSFLTYLYPNNESVTHSSTTRPFLSQIVLGNESYSFEYYDPSLLPVYTSYYQDHWGFFNGKPNSDLMSNYGNPLPMYFPQATANRNADPQYSYYGMLKKVTHPTGGIDSIIYEGNKSVAGDNVGGNRVKYIYTSDKVTSNLSVKRFYYNGLSSLNTSSGQTVIPTFDRTFETGVMTTCTPDGSSGQPYSFSARCSFTQRTSNPLNNLNIYNGGHIAYSLVTESFGGDNFENGGIEHEYVVDNHDYAYPVYNGEIYSAPLCYSAKFHGREIRTKVFKKVGAQFIPLTEQLHYYHSSTLMREYKSYQATVRYVDDLITFGPGSFSGIDILKTLYQSWWEKLDSTVTINYDENGLNPLKVKKQYFYNTATHLMPIKMETTNSKGTVISSTYKYPADFAVGSNIYADMIANNVLTPLIEKTDYNVSSITQQSRTSYKKVGQYFVPESVQNYYQAGPLNTLLVFDTYTANGNITQHTPKEGIKHGFIWDYASHMPVAEAINATSAEIAYTSFESDGKGNFNFTGLSDLDNTAVTGIKTYTLGAGKNITRTGLLSTGTYIVSYWAKGGAKNVNGAGNTSGPTFNGWTYYEHKVVNPASGTITISGTDLIDELRLYPERAQMTTFTYDLLVGMTSQVDVNNRVTYYEYDNEGRLMLVRDQEKNVLKKNCYMYYNQEEENCSLFYNQPLSQQVTRICDPGYIGGSVTYNIPGNIFSSSVSIADANAKAQAYLDATKQAYAAARTTCTLQCTTGNCNGANKKCINNVCETAIKVYTSSVYLGPHWYLCTYHYEWSDGSWSANFEEESIAPCYTIWD